MTPSISVLIPAYNDEAYLADALGSVIGQTLGDLEIIVADDASHDGTAALAEAWAVRDGRIRVLRNGVNLGMTDNWNRALGEACAPLVFKLDADDVLEPETLARLLAAFHVQPDLCFAACRTVECDVTLTSCVPFHGEAAFAKAGLDPAQDRVMPGWSWFELSFDDYQLWHSSAQLHRREGLVAAGGWDASFGCASDTDLLLRLTATARPVAHLGYVGVQYRRRAGSISNVFAERGWKRLEATLVAARALQECGRGRHVRLRRQWWRYWSNARALRDSPQVFDSLAEPARSRLQRVMASLRPPAIDVTVEGWIRDRLWHLRHGARQRG